MTMKEKTKGSDSRKKDSAGKDKYVVHTCDQGEEDS
jgi:hypothetical protein